MIVPAVRAAGVSSWRRAQGAPSPVSTTLTCFTASRASPKFGTAERASAGVEVLEDRHGLVERLLEVVRGRDDLGFLPIG
ncbi:hypothetical protein PHK61_24640 [Actinomycetospora lutea]|uniref:hypothetical protein n=1 Tax=Actinomycetospora lutea TaxID=663604 RepID=UPI00236515B4|nr:hypothetical protein [Actinomycetospora lutea]MDD7941614.1 hypothetical protein [Actinomycetospora lutea]